MSCASSTVRSRATRFAPEPSARSVRSLTVNPPSASASSTDDRPGWSRQLPGLWTAVTDICTRYANRSPQTVRIVLSVGGAALFCVLATQNAGGYRYGVQDQAFYIPAIARHLDPTLYPHDTALLDAHGQLIAFDEATARLLTATGWSLPPLFFGAQLVTLVLLFAGAAGLGRTLYRSWWTVAGLAFALTIRHNVSDTGVNTLEGYFHPRMLAFALGAVALALFVRRRPWPALAVAAAAGPLHPTMGVWFVVWVGVAVIVAESQTRRVLGGLAVAAAAVAVVFVFAGPLRDQLVLMDASWTGALFFRDYLFPTDWPWATWAANLAYGVAIGAMYWYRRSAVGVSSHETGLVAGCGVLLLIFLVSVPLSAAGVALVVQLQVARIFWMLDFFFTVYFVWLLIERPVRGRSASASASASVRVRYAGLALFAVGAIVRGGYVMEVEFPDRALFEPRFASGDWHEVMAWSALTPAGTNLLLHPGHAGRYGSSARAAAKRDVYLEDKDGALAIYSRSVARRVSNRRRDLGDFGALNASRARALARQYDLQYLITILDIDLPVAHLSGPFTVYDLDGP